MDIKISMVFGLQAYSSTESTNLLSLPVELQTEILLASTWKDVLHIRMTCKVLFEATRLRAIWAHLVTEHISNHSCPPRLERPIDLYTATELEHLLLLWKRTDAAFAGHDAEPVRERKFSTKHETRYSHFVEGGRWLLNVDCAGAVTYYDLDAETIAETPLIPAHLPYFRSNKVEVSVVYDNESPMLKFTIALFLTVDIVQHNVSGRFHIWSITLILDSLEQAVGLVATHLAKFPLRPSVDFLHSISVSGHYLAFNGSHQELEELHIFVVCWKDANGQSDIYPWRMLQKSWPDETVHLLSGGQFLIIYCGAVELYDYTTIEETEDALTPALPPCLWRHDFNTGFRFTSERLSTRTTTRFILVVWRTFYSLDIPNDLLSDATPVLAEAMNLSRYDNISSHWYLGSFRAMTFRDDHDAEFLQYSPQYDSKVLLCKKLISSKLPAYFSLVYMDEHIGRVVIPTNWLPVNESIVIDLV